MSLNRTNGRRVLALVPGTAALLLLVSLGTAAHAAPITYRYGRIITTADPSTGVAAGAPFSGMLTYDPAQALYPTMMTDGIDEYDFGHMFGSDRKPTHDGSSLSLQVGGNQVYSHSGGLQVGISDSQYRGQYGYRDAGPFTQLSIVHERDDGSPLLVALSLSNPSRSVFGSLAVPTSLNLADFTQSQLTVTDFSYPGTKTIYTGTIESLTVVPEPATSTLICLAAAGWLARSARRRASP